SSFILDKTRPDLYEYPVNWRADETASVGLTAAAFHVMISPKPESRVLDTVPVGVVHPFKPSSIYHCPLPAPEKTVSVKFLMAILLPAVAVMVSDFMAVAVPMNPVESSSSMNRV